MNIIDEMKEALELEKVEKYNYTKALRAFCRTFGGQIYYFPSKLAGKRAELLYNIITSCLIENSEAEKIMRVLVKEFGGIAEYIPKELKAFRAEIAEEIYLFYLSSNKNKMNEICICYNISYALVFRLLKEHKKKLKKERLKKIESVDFLSKESKYTLSNKQQYKDNSEKTLF